MSQTEAECHIVEVASLSYGESAELCSEDRAQNQPVDAQALNAEAAAPAARPDGIFVDCARGKAANPKSSVQPYQARHVCQQD